MPSDHSSPAGFGVLWNESDFPDVNAFGSSFGERRPTRVNLRGALDEELKSSTLLLLGISESKGL